MFDRKGHVDVMRKSGVLLPVSAIPSRYGIGAFSREAYTFIDLLEEAGQSYWQILPLGTRAMGILPISHFPLLQEIPIILIWSRWLKLGI